ncbi:MAG: ribulose-phosphate 3-epimerase [Alphaproteobacteria bacterium]|nr:ribulose-phosphate 3-epimerase [Alphaproteobacteria bacterium]
MVLIAPSLLAANPACLGDEVKQLENAGADLLHFDVMDGHFVPNMTYGPFILRKLKKITHMPFDVHLMVDNPEKIIPWFIEAGADIITFHLEATSQPDELLKTIQNAGIKAGVSLKPNSNMKIISQLNRTPDLVLVMGVEPGFGGQTFRPDTPQRIVQTKQLCPSALIEVDGGINQKTAQLCIDAGAEILVAGTAVFENGSYKKNILSIKGDAQ